MGTIFVMRSHVRRVRWLRRRRVLYPILATWMRKALIALLYRASLRINEALSLYPKDLDLADGRVRRAPSCVSQHRAG